MFDCDVVDRVIQTIVDELSPKIVIVFGSVASHTARTDGDIDILVVMETDLSRPYRSIPIDICLRRFTVDKDIRGVTPKEFEAEKDDEYSFISEIMKTRYVACEA